MKRSKRLTQRARLVVVALVLVAATLLLACWWLPTFGRWLAVPPVPGHADVIAVHGGTAVRTRSGAALFRQGVAPELWHTGYPEREAPNTALALRYGVPSEHFRYLWSESTWQDGQAIAEQANVQHIRTVLVVTEWWHSRRALCVDQQALRGVTILYVPASGTAYSPDNWWRSGEGRWSVLDELAKFGYYWVRYGMVPWRC